MLKIRFNIQTS